MNIRISLLWRTVILLAISVVMCQILMYFWIQRSVNSHFEVMDAEILTHAAFNLRKSSELKDYGSDNSERIHLHNDGLDYDIKVFRFNDNGKPIISEIQKPNLSNRTEGLDIKAINILELMNTHGDKQFELQLNNRPYRSIIIRNNNLIYLLALPIDVHHLYLHQFSLQLKVILAAITLLLLFIAAFSVYWGFSPLATFIQKMKTINSDQLGERIKVSDMPSELRQLAESYNIMMSKLEDNFESLSRYSDNIAHELRTPIATLSTQTQVMLSKPRQINEYIEQLHHQHETLEHLSEVINNMLLLAKTQKGLNQEQLKNVDMESLINQLIEYYELLAEDRGIHLIKRGNFAAIKGNKELLQRLFSNLISNAIYYSKNHSTVHISAHLKHFSDQLNYSEVELAEFGNELKSSCLPALIIIIENEMLEPMTVKDTNLLFERFYRHSNKNTNNAEITQHSGTGLGLSIVKSIVSAHGGSISISVNEDSFFKVELVFPINSE